MGSKDLYISNCRYCGEQKMDTFVKQKFRELYPNHSDEILANTVHAPECDCYEGREWRKQEQYKNFKKFENDFLLPFTEHWGLKEVSCTTFEDCKTKIKDCDGVYRIDTTDTNYKPANRSIPYSEDHMEGADDNEQ